MIVRLIIVLICLPWPVLDVDGALGLLAPVRDADVVAQHEEPHHVLRGYHVYIYIYIYI